MGESASESYDGGIRVQLIDEVELATFVARTFRLSRHDDSSVSSSSSDAATAYQSREIRHFQFTAWPDHAVPEHATPVLSFVKRVKAHCSGEMGPVVVHCRSAHVDIRLAHSILMFLLFDCISSSSLS